MADVMRGPGAPAAHLSQSAGAQRNSGSCAAAASAPGPASSVRPTRHLSRRPAGGPAGALLAAESGHAPPFARLGPGAELRACGGAPSRKASANAGNRGARLSTTAAAALLAVGSAETSAHAAAPVHHAKLQRLSCCCTVQDEGHD